MVSRPDRKRRNAESPSSATCAEGTVTADVAAARNSSHALVRPEDEGTEEFQVSVLLHCALLLALTAVFALQGKPAMDPSVRAYPVRLVGPLEVARPGAALVPQPDPGAREKSGPNRQLSTGPRVAKAPGKRSPEKTAQRPKPRKPKVIGENGRVGKPVQKPDSTVDATVAQTGPQTSRTPRPFAAGFELDELSKFSSDRTAKTPLQSALGGVDLGEPLTADVPGDEPEMPETGGQGTEEAAPSGNPESTNDAGGAACEIAGLESVGGGAEGFAPPKVISRILPDYPEWARKKGVKGMAVYKVLIQESGTVGDVISLSSTLDAKLAILGAQALRRWVFSPVLVGGEPKPTWVQLTLQFKLS